MNYIVDPKIIYLISVLSNLKVFLEILVAFLVAVDFAIPIYIVLTESKEEKEFFKKVFKINFITVIIISLFLVFIPNKETMYKMIVTENITYENIEKGKETIKDTVGYIIEKVDELKEGK